MTVVDDQRGQPTWSADLADLLARLVEAGAPPGTYHAAAAGETTWFGFAQEVVVAAGLARDVVAPTTTAAFARPAARPGYSVLGQDGLALAGVAPIGHWRDRWWRAASEVLDPVSGSGRPA